VEGRRREGSNAHEALAQVSATDCHYLTVAAPKPRYAEQVRGICRLCILELEYRGYLNAEIQSEQEPIKK
jgi:hypothetical protein